MPDENTYTGVIKITPPLTALQARNAPAMRDLALRMVETQIETEDGAILTQIADGVHVPHSSWDARRLVDDLQSLVYYVETLPKHHDLTDFIEVQWDPGYGLTPPSRYVVREGRVVEVKAQIVWPEDVA